MDLVIVGRSSALGTYIAKVAPKSWRVRYVKHDVRSSIPPLNLAEGSVVINCAAITMLKPNPLFRDRPTLFQVNAMGAGAVAFWAKAHGAYLIHVSCDSVMGTRGPYYDTEFPYPQSDLAYSKFVGELAVRAICYDYPHTIVRFGWLFGARYLSGFPVVAASRKEPHISDEERGQPIHGESAAKALMMIIREKQAGHSVPETIHVSTARQPVSWYEYLEPHYPNIEPIYRRGRGRLYDEYGLYPSSEGRRVADGMDLFKVEMARHPLWRDAKRP